MTTTWSELGRLLMLAYSRRRPLALHLRELREALLAEDPKAELPEGKALWLAVRDCHSYLRREGLLLEHQWQRFGRVVIIRQEEEAAPELAPEECVELAGDLEEVPVATGVTLAIVGRQTPMGEGLQLELDIDGNVGALFSLPLEVWEKVVPALGRAVEKMKVVPPYKAPGRRNRRQSSK